ncbi:MAG: hypothetical protein KBD66_02215 [Candidatus Doudnabacteria bacterium]|nr:hypothetical protein [Candidatus Doudnabacteria bacterium]
MNTKQKKIAVGTGLAALAAAAAAGTYFFAGTRGAKNRAKVQKWAESAKKDVVKQLKSLEQVSKKTYAQTVDTVMDQYQKAKKLKPQEMVALAAELKGHWDAIATEVATAGKKVAPLAKKVAKKVLPAKKTPAKKTSAKKTASKK